MKIYSAVISGKNKIDVFDVERGVRSYTINLGNVEIINGPVVTYDKLTVVVRTTAGKTMGKVYTLKSGILSYSFNVAG